MPGQRRALVQVSSAPSIARGPDACRADRANEGQYPGYKGSDLVAFGSMWSSSYPGMSSMGKLMALALLCTMAAAVLFQPVLMGRPRQIQEPSLRRSVAPSPAE